MNNRGIAVLGVRNASAVLVAVAMARVTGTVPVDPTGIVEENWKPFDGNVDIEGQERPFENPEACLCGESAVLRVPGTNGHSGYQYASVLSAASIGIEAHRWEPARKAA